MKHFFSLMKADVKGKLVFPAFARNIFQGRGGFTIPELIVAMGLFVTVVSIFVGGFVNIVRAQRQAANLLSVNSNVSLAIEQMSRAIRTASGFCGAERGGGLPLAQNCPGESKLTFYDPNDTEAFFCFDPPNGNDPGRIRIGRGFVGAGLCDDAVSEPLTASNVDVRNARFILSGDGSNDGQPRVTIVLVVAPAEEGSVSDVEIPIQTTISSRVPDATTPNP